MVVQVSKRVRLRSLPVLTDEASAPVFRALGDPTRLAILARLAAACGARRVGDIAGCCTVDLYVVSRHLAVLRQAGVVESRRVGREVFYEVRYAEVVALLRQLAAAMEACCVKKGNQP